MKFTQELKVLFSYVDLETSPSYVNKQANNHKQANKWTSG